MSENFESRVRRAKTTATSNNGSFATKTNAETPEALEPEAVGGAPDGAGAPSPPCPDCDGDGGIEAHGGLIVCMTCEGDGTVSPAREAVLDAVGGPESMAVAKSALWRTALWADAPDLYGEEDDEGYHECYFCGTQSPTGEIDAHMRYSHPQYTSGLTAADIDPESKAKVEADFEAWAAENTDAVKAFTETVKDPEGGDPAEFLAHNWWLSKNGHGAGLRDRLADDPAYAEAVREREARIVAYSEAMRTDPAGPNTWSGLDEIKATTPLDILRKKAQAADSEWRRNYGAGYKKLHDGRSTAKTYGEAQDRENRAYAAKEAAERAVRRAEALTALAKATPTQEYSVYVGDSGMVHID